MVFQSLTVLTTTEKVEESARILMGKNNGPQSSLGFVLLHVFGQIIHHFGMTHIDSVPRLIAKKAPLLYMLDLYSNDYI